MLILGIILSLISPQHLLKDNVKVEFEFTSMQLGKPTLAFYHYNVSLTNNTNTNIYVVLPRWFEEELAIKGNVWGAQYDSFDKVKGYTLFGNSSFTIIGLKAKEKKVLKEYDIETFDEKIQKKLTTGISYITCSDVTVGSYTLLEFMDKSDLFDDNLEYVLKDAEVKNMSIKVSK